MTATTAIANIFYSFWFVLGEHFVYLVAFGLLFVIFYSVYYLMIKR